MPVLNPTMKWLIPFSANKPRTNGWIIFFNAFNLAFGAYFLVLSLTQSAAALSPRPGRTSTRSSGNLLLQRGNQPGAGARDRPGHHPGGFLGACSSSFPCCGRSG